MILYVVLSYVVQFLLMLNFMLAIVVDSYAKVKEELETQETSSNIVSDICVSAQNAVRGLLYRWPTGLVTKLQNRLVVETIGAMHVENALGISHQVSVCLSVCLSTYLPIYLFEVSKYPYCECIHGSEVVNELVESFIIDWKLSVDQTAKSIVQAYYENEAIRFDQNPPDRCDELLLKRASKMIGVKKAHDLVGADLDEMLRDEQERRFESKLQDLEARMASKISVLDSTMQGIVPQLLAELPRALSTTNQAHARGSQGVDSASGGGTNSQAVGSLSSLPRNRVDGSSGKKALGSTEASASAAQTYTTT